MDEFERIVAMFRKHEGWLLSRVWTQRSSITRSPDEQDALPSEAEVRIVIDFKNLDTNAIQSVYIRVNADEAGLNVLGFGEYA